MSIKSLAHLAQQRIRTSSAPAFKNSHFYELLAAAFDYKSHAAFGADAALLTQTYTHDSEADVRRSRVLARCISLGYEADASERVSNQLCSLFAEQHLHAAQLSDLVRELRLRNYCDEDYSPPDDDFEETYEAPPSTSLSIPEDADLASSLLLESLEASAKRGSALAHYALALLREPDRYEGAPPLISPYWHSQRQAGKELVGVQIEWADAYTRQEANKILYERHLREAARLGHKQALLNLAEYFNDPAVFNARIDLSDEDPIHLAGLAVAAGRPDEAKRWLTAAAESGDTDAMRSLIEGYDAGDLQTCWKWLHLARLLDVDLTSDRHYAIHEDGSPYDDDVGGTIFVDGDDGIELASISDEEDAVAQAAARVIFDRLSRK